MDFVLTGQRFSAVSYHVENSNCVVCNLTKGSSCFYMCIYRHQWEPDKISGYPRRLWVLCKEEQVWQNSDEIPIASALSNECAGKV